MSLVLPPPKNSRLCCTRSKTLAYKAPTSFSWCGVVVAAPLVRHVVYCSLALNKLYLTLNPSSSSLSAPYARPTGGDPTSEVWPATRPPAQRCHERPSPATIYDLRFFCFPISTMKWACSIVFQKDSTKQSSTPKSTQASAVRERGNQGQTQHRGTAAGTAYSALVARRLSRPGLVDHSALCFSSFLLLLKIDGKPCFTFFFSQFSPKLGLQNLTGARIACTLTVTLLSHSLWA